MNLFARALAGDNLTPFERAALKLLEGLACAAAVAVLPIIADALSSHDAVDWTAIARTALAAAAVAVLLAFVKYCKAHGDDPLLQVAGQAAQNEADSLSAANGLNEAVEEVAVNQALDASGLLDSEPVPPAVAPVAP